ncbi:MAG TPA: gluconate 2-dehydrogenase subunit 3 family protein [Candidatus Acidoferrum sp.]|nr:gluconate 2-dehydrogenase subunit 3 family protein [Candidatus Acidoferrum sp.]
MREISRRDVLKNLAVSAAGGSVLQMMPAEAAALAHQMVRKEKATSAGKYAPKYFSPHQYKTLTALCDAVIPKDEKSCGAVEAGAPEFIDLLCSENEEFQLQIGGGLHWLDNTCRDRYEHTFLESTPAQKKEILNLIAYRKNAKSDPSLTQGIAFFARLRQMTCDAFYTSRIGIEDLQYIGNTALAEFPGCPPFPNPES